MLRETSLSEQAGCGSAASCASSYCRRSAYSPVWNYRSSLPACAWSEALQLVPGMNLEAVTGKLWVSSSGALAGGSSFAGSGGSRDALCLPGEAPASLCSLQEKWDCGVTKASVQVEFV